ncbi:MAG: hypothetical protein CMC04_05955 [Flavobacteriaceae bacterium]|nr:hypothetical protein [Flavobacteriaceae bacterium]
MKKPSIAILLEFGFHEVKKYIHSGFVIELSKNFEIVWFAINKGNSEFHNYFTSTGFPLVYFDEKDFMNHISSLEKFNQIIRRNWIANKSLGGFHNHSLVRKKSFKTAILGNSIAKFIFENLTIKYVQKVYTSKIIQNKIIERNIDLLFLTGYNSYFSKAFAATGIKMNKEVHYLTNSWKDLFINNFIPFTSLSTIFVWSEQMIKDFKYHMPYLKKSNFVISGNPTFDVLLDAKPLRSRKFYAEKYGLPINSKWLLYTMMPVGLVKDEIDTIQFVANELLSKYTKEQYTIIVRKNPTHKLAEFKDLDLPENLIIANHYCSYDETKDMIIQSKEGENEWLDLIHFSALNISVPSTVTLEFLALNKPVLNIEFNSQNKLDSRIRQFFEAGFYKPLLKEKKVKHCQNISTLLNEIQIAQFPIKKNTKKNIKAIPLIIDNLKKNVVK